MRTYVLTIKTAFLLTIEAEMPKLPKKCSKMPYFCPFFQSAAKMPGFLANSQNFTTKLRFAVPETSEYKFMGKYLERTEAEF
jgi:hypothetical protein